MKKIILLIVVGLFSSALVGQRYKITYSASAEAEPCDPDPIRNSYDRILIENTDENKSFVLALAHCDALIDNKVNAVGYINFFPNAISEKRYAESLSGTVVIDDFQRNPISFNHCDTKSTTLFFKTVTVTIEPDTEINDQPANNTLCDITLNVDVAGFSPEVYVWQYWDVLSSATDKWTNFPSEFLGRDTINFGLIELFGSRAGEYHNKAIQFRMKRYCEGKYTNAITYVMIGCSPILQEPVATQKTTCSYTNDGSFTLNFDRDLNSGEELVVTLYDGNDDSILVGQNYTTSLVNNSGVYSFSWSENLDAKTYRVKFQSHNGSGGIPETDPSWNSLEFSNPFTVGRATVVNFSVVDSSDENCFDTNDGYIEIQGSRESGRSLLYQYSINGGSSYTNWRAFLNGNTTKINGLGKGNYRIKVRDSQGCLAKLN